MDSPGPSTSRYDGGSLLFSFDRATNQLRTPRASQARPAAPHPLPEPEPGQPAQQAYHRRRISMTDRRFFPDRFPRM